jgi:hypothetical protein
MIEKYNKESISSKNSEHGAKYIITYYIALTIN